MIPHELTQFPHWVCWKYELDLSAKLTKIPYTPTTGHKASHSNPHSWCDYATCVAACNTGYYSGIGFVASEYSPYTFIDLDDPEKDTTPEQAQEIRERFTKVIQMMDSYTEWSPSGKGMHIIVRGKVPDGRRRAKIELYPTLRFMTMTGNVYYNAPIADRTDVLQHLWADLGGEQVSSVEVREQAATKTDLEIYNIAVNASNGEKFYHLWNGRFQDAGYPTQSEADFALINILSFYSRNSEQIERMFLQSGLGYRIASGQKKKAKNYVKNMITRSFDNQEPDIDLTALMAKAEEAFRKHKEPISAPSADPLEWELPPGLLGEITAFIYEQAPLQVREIALAGAISFLAGLVGRYYNVSDQGLNVYMLMLAGTGKGKEAMALGINKLHAAIGATVPAISQFSGPSEIASAPALMKYLDGSPCCLSILGEFGLRLHQMCSDQAPAHMVGIRRALLDLFHKSGKAGQVSPHVYSDKAKNTEKLYSPAYSILGESTPDTFYRHIDESMLSDGLLPRFVCIEYTGPRMDLNKKHSAVQPSAELTQRLVELTTACLGMASKRRVVDCMFTPDAEKLYYSLAATYTKLINQNQDSEISVQLYNRAHLKIMKIAALIAVGVNPYNPVISVEHIEWSRKLIEYDINNILIKFQTGKVGRETGESNQASEVARAIKDYLMKPYGPALAKALVDERMHKARIVPYSYVNRQCAARAAFRADRMGSTYAIRRALESLQQEGLIREVKPHILQEQFGKSMKAYIVIEPTAFNK